ncbi:ABC transporter substrate-binding protein [Salipiger manganoxidans]|uniref:ABC transporter substrate-binding protein n=2 Tax=Salipiger marinus TaxID=555512 RepID=UPI001E4B1257|nr:ABC transporter substrate-binding protein [Salipiger manganoxidans]MCD1618004.1 ABC transporter substrate-binding protein [Salipiger manganoxidans]
MNQILSAVRSSFRARTVAASLLLATALPLAAIAAPEGELRIAVGADATTFHPHVNSLPVGNTVDGLVFQQLFRIDADNKVVPALATDYGWSEDGMTFTVSFETGHSFTNGRPVNAEAVAASFNQLLDPDSGSIYAGLYASLGKAEAQGEDTVVFHMAEPNGHVLMLLANSAAGIIDTDANAEMGAEYGRKPVGSGPYMVEEFIGGERFTLVPNPDYKGARPATLERITFMAVPEDGSRMALLETGEVDIVDRVPAESIPTIDALDTASVILPDSMFSISMEMVLRGPLEDKRVREALNISIDRDGMVQGILGGLGTPSQGQVGPGTEDALRVTFEPKPYDPERAKALLAEAGFGPDSPLELRVNCPNGRYIKDSQVCQALTGQWQAIGVKATPNVLDLPSWSAAHQVPIEERSYDMSMIGRATAGIDFTVYRLFRSGVSANTTGFNNARVDSLLADGRATTDLEEQKKIYAEIQQIVWDEMPFVFLWYQKQAIGIADTVTGFTIRPDETMLFDTVQVSVDG